MRRLAATAIVLALACTACAKTNSTLVVGAVYPTGGAQGPGGTEEFRGASLAAELVNRHGGVRGRDVRLDLNPADSAEGVPDAVRTLARKTNIVIGSYGSTLSAVAAQVAAQRNVVFWETGAVGEMPGKLARSDRFFRVAPTGAELGAAAVSFVRDRVLSKEPNVTYGVAYVDDVYGRAVGGGALKEIRRSGIDPKSFPYTINHMDFDALAQRIASERIDVLVVAAYIDDGVELRRSLVREQVPLLANIGTSSSYCMPEFGRRLGPDAVGVFASDKPDGDILRTQSLKPGAVTALNWARRTYQREYSAPMPAPALAGFAGAWALLHDVLPKASGDTSAAIARAARSTTLPSGSLPNGSGLRFVGGDNTRALTVIWEWVAEDQRAVVWPPAFATQRLVAR